jgi:hypothetical protein
MTPEIAIQLFQRVGIPGPITEFKFHPTRLWRFDYAWPDRKLALEVDGGIWTGGRHVSAQGFHKDMEKKNAAAILGWRILYITPKSVGTILMTSLVQEALKA